MEKVFRELEATDDVTLVHGKARGADQMAEAIAIELGWDVEAHAAEWTKYGRAAGSLRNQAMVNAGADICLAFPLPSSIGTRDCIRRAEIAGIPVRVIE